VHGAAAAPRRRSDDGGAFIAERLLDSTPGAVLAQDVVGVQSLVAQNSL
jgi:hypothetical protein